MSTTGAIVVLNGPSSAGKTTLARAVRARIGVTAAAISLDEFFAFRHPDAKNDWRMFSTLSEAAFATRPGSLAHGAAGVREALTGFIAMEGNLDLEVTRVLVVDDLALVIGVWSFDGTGPDGEPVRLEARNADVLRRQPDGSWRFVIDNPWGTS